jgi:predicted AlkP superfamily pyrophosphatase or phosphodiesterase
VLSGNAGDSLPGDAYYQQWQRSPYADAYVGRMAAGLADAMQLGKSGKTDVLALSFASPDLVGHVFGPRSQEVRDMYAQLDRTIGTLLERLDALVGANQYVVALTSDHGVTDIPEQSKAAGRDGGRIDLAGALQAIETAAQGALGPGKYVARVSFNDVYFEPGVFGKLAANASGMAAVMKAASAQPGIARVFRGDELAGAATSKDELLRAVALSYVADRRGELILAPKAGWMTGSTGTTHGSANPDDQRVPIIFFGQGIKPGRYTNAATPADIAPTLADICGIVMKHAKGAVLRSARN